jgi:hypothetical protein
LSSEDVDSDFWSITSDILRFFKIGFLLMNEPLFDKFDGGVELSDVIGWDCAGCRGPYSHVTSDSLSLQSMM